LIEFTFEYLGAADRDADFPQFLDRPFDIVLRRPEKL
jgi:hypothetical protein